VQAVVDPEWWRSISYALSVYPDASPRYSKDLPLLREETRDPSEYLRMHFLRQSRERAVRRCLLPKPSPPPVAGSRQFARYHRSAALILGPIASDMFDDRLGRSRRRRAQQRNGHLRSDSSAGGSAATGEIAPGPRSR